MITLHQLANRLITKTVGGEFGVFYTVWDPVIDKRVGGSQWSARSVPDAKIIKFRRVTNPNTSDVLSSAYKQLQIHANRFNIQIRRLNK